MKEGASVVRVGIISDIDRRGGKARVYYPSMDDMVSDWLYIMRYPSCAISMTVSNSGGHSHDGGIPYDGEHSHSISATITDWFPEINDKVLVLYPPGFNTDGYILGVIQ